MSQQYTAHGAALTLHTRWSHGLPLQVHGYAIYKDGKYAAVRYPTEGYSADVAGRSFHHGRFVQKLRLRAASQQSVTCREATVRKLINGEPQQLPS